MKLRANQNGFGSIVIVLAIMVIALAGTVGWMVYDKQKTNNSTKSDDIATTSYQKAQSDSPYFDNGPKYLELKEWGVKLPTTGDIADAYYLYKKDADTVYLSKDTYRGTTCAADAITLGAIGRVSVASASPDEKTAYLEHGVERKGYYYFYVRPQAGCGTDSTSELQVNSYVAQFKTAVDKLSD